MPTDRSVVTHLLQLLAMLVFSQSAAAADHLPVHVTDVEMLLAHLDLANTDYRHGRGDVHWEEPVASHTDCSGLVDHLLMHSYGYTAKALEAWLGSQRPTARLYFEAITAQRGFTSVACVKDVQPGDFIAVDYLINRGNTGHIMIVASAPASCPSLPPLIAETVQWTVTVIDSSESGHGATDTRYQHGQGGRDHDGLGKGVIRLYARPDGTVAGFTWSTFMNSAFKGPDTEPVALGRLIDHFQP